MVDPAAPPRKVVRKEESRANHADIALMLALSIRQPYAELILRGVKTIEYRSRPTRKIGERFAIYAARKWAGFPPHLMQDAIGKDWIPDSAGMTDPPLREGDLPTGVLVGSAIISDCIYKDGWWEWRLEGVRRYKRARGLRAGVQPQPVWFRAA